MCIRDRTKTGSRRAARPGFMPERKRPHVSRLRRTIIPLLIIVVVLVLVQTVMRGNSSSSVKYAYQGGSQSFVSQLNSDDVSSVLVLSLIHISEPTRPY